MVHVFGGEYTTSSGAVVAGVKSGAAYGAAGLQQP